MRERLCGAFVTHKILTAVNVCLFRFQETSKCRTAKGFGLVQVCTWQSGGTLKLVAFTRQLVLSRLEYTQVGARQAARLNTAPCSISGLNSQPILLFAVC